MPKPKNEVIEQVRNAARMFQAVIDLAESLGEVGSIEQALAEAKMKLSRVASDTDAATASLEGILAKVKEAEEREAQALAEAEACRINAIEHANQEALRITTLAKEAADGITQEAAARKKSADQDLAGITRDIEVRGKELNDLEARITRAKAKMAELLGA